MDAQGNELINYKSSKDAKAYVGTRDLVIDKRKTSLPVHVIYAVMDNLINEILTNLECSTYTVFIGHPDGQNDTFRHKIAKTAVYKGNRKADSKPIHIRAAKERLISKYGAVVATDLETDDILGIEQCKPDSNSIIASIDKDMWMIPGWHYNISTKEKFFSTDPGTLELVTTPNGTKKLIGTGFKFFAAQLLMGDVVDNIKKPVKGMGITKIFQQLNEKDAILKIWEHVVGVYMEAGLDIHENATLLWILREQGKNYLDVIRQARLEVKDNEL